MGEQMPEWKRIYYRNGWYVFPVPPVSTRQWSEHDWIQYVDRCGAWTGPRAHEDASADEAEVEASKQLYPMEGK